jgi:hypothetical protein
MLIRLSARLTRMGIVEDEVRGVVVQNDTHVIMLYRPHSSVARMAP